MGQRVINKRKDYFEPAILLWRKAGAHQAYYLRGAGQKILDRLIKITFLGEAEAAIKLGIKFWFADVGA